MHLEIVNDWKSQKYNISSVLFLTLNDFVEYEAKYE